MKKLFTLMIIATLAFPLKANIMTVAQLKKMSEMGQMGELAVVSYIQGTVDGLLGFDSTLVKEGKLKDFEFCKIQNAMRSKNPPRHPAEQWK